MKWFLGLAVGAALVVPTIAAAAPTGANLVSDAWQTLQRPEKVLPVAETAHASTLASDDMEGDLRKINAALKGLSASTEPMRTDIENARASMGATFKPKTDANH